MTFNSDIKKTSSLTRREFIVNAGILAVGIGTASFMFNRRGLTAETFVAKVDTYSQDIASIIRRGLKELGVDPKEIRGKRILLKPNMVEYRSGTDHINTHPMVVRGAAEAFMALGAAEIFVGEGPGHVRDSLHILEESGMAEVLVDDRIPFVDLNNDALFKVPNRSGLMELKTLTLPATIKKVDWIVSIAKMKTHHWAGATLSMKNLFGVMPGNVYGWPKNVLHHNGIERSILDINATLRPNFAIVDGIIGMEGDGPIMGEPVHAGVLAMGRNLPAVDATCCRIMGVNPLKVPHLILASYWLGPVSAESILQRGEKIADVRRDFALREDIPAQKDLRDE